MGVNIKDIPNRVATLEDLALIYGAEPDLSPDGYADAAITKANFFLPLQTQITTNTNNAVTLAARVTVLEGGSLKRSYDAQNAAFTFSQTADSVLEKIFFRVVSGTPTVAVGTSLAGEQIVESALITGSFKADDCDPAITFSTSIRTIYITVTGGVVDVAVFSKEGLFDI